ncbi:MAG: zinc-binding dehydrogenase [Burkholderiaceae bacterium]
MKAAVVTARGLEVRDVDVPVAGPEEVLVRVRASGLNRADLGMRAGHAHGSSGGVGTVLGLECAGEVVATGLGIDDLALGDRVMCSVRGGHAEYALAHRGRVHRIPANMSFAEAACYPVALQTMHDAVVVRGRLAPGESVLVQGASSGVGLMALQIARRFGAKQVIGSSGNDARRKRLHEFGADASIDTRDPDWPEEVLRLTDGRGVDLVVDQLAGPYANGNLRATAVLGRIVNVGRLAGMHADFDFDLHALRRIEYIGVTFRTRSVAEVNEINRLMIANLGAALAAGELRLPIDRRFPLDQADAALDHMQANAHFGKLVLEVG